MDNKDWDIYYRKLISLAYAHADLGDYDKAIALNKERIDYYGKQKNPVLLNRAYQHMGTFFLKTTPPKLDSAFFYFDKAIPFYDSTKYYLGLGSINAALGKYFKAKNNPNRSESYLLKGFNYAKMGNSQTAQMETAKLLSQLYKQKADYEKALFYYEEYEYWKDSLNRRKVSSQLENQEIQSAYELNKVESEKLAFENENIRMERRWLGLTVALVIFLLLVLLFAYKKMREAKKGLEVLNNLQTNFFVNATHEFMTPLTLISGLIKQILKQEDIGESPTKKLKIVENNSHHLIDLANEILTSVKLEHRKPALEEVTIELYDFLKLLVSSFENIAKERTIDFTFNYAISYPLFIKIDEKKLKKILYNLLFNAFKFSSTNDSISLSILEVNDRIKIEVSDTGEGIAKEDLPFIFNRFYQTQNREKLQKGGTGIGLAICQEYTQILKGTLAVESKIDVGSKFSLFIPKKEVNQVETIKKDNYSSPINITTKQSKPLIATSFYKRKLKSTILIVEDNLDMQEYIASILMPNYDCIKSANGEEAIQILKKLGEDLPDLIIADVMMPVMDGYTFAKKIKSTALWCSIPFIFLSARNSKSDYSLAFTIGIDDFITKPFDDAMLLASANNFLHKDYEETEKRNIALADIKWLQKVEALVKKEISNPQLSVSFMAEKMEISERQLRRKIKQILNISPNQYFNEIKLQMARTFLEEDNNKNLTEIAKTVGFNSPNYFIKKFETRFGKLPSE